MPLLLGCGDFDADLPLCFGAGEEESDSSADGERAFFFLKGDPCFLDGGESANFPRRNFGAGETDVCFFLLTGDSGDLRRLRTSGDCPLFFGGGDSDGILLLGGERESSIFLLLCGGGGGDSDGGFLLLTGEGDPEGARLALGGGEMDGSFLRPSGSGGDPND